MSRRYPLPRFHADHVEACYARADAATRAEGMTCCCILDPAFCQLVCIDRHAVAVALGRPVSPTAQTYLQRKGSYDKVAQCYRIAAAEVGILPSQMQAITWLQWRKEIAS